MYRYIEWKATRITNKLTNYVYIQHITISILFNTGLTLRKNVIIFYTIQDYL